MKTAYIHSVSLRHGNDIEYKVLDAHFVLIGAGLVTISGQFMVWGKIEKTTELPNRPRWLYKLLRMPPTYKETETDYAWVRSFANISSITVQSNRVEIHDTEST